MPVFTSHIFQCCESAVFFLPVFQCWARDLHVFSCLVVDYCARDFPAFSYIEVGCLAEISLILNYYSVLWMGVVLLLPLCYSVGAEICMSFPVLRFSVGQIFASLLLLCCRKIYLLPPMGRIIIGFIVGGSQVFSYCVIERICLCTDLWCCNADESCLSSPVILLCVIEDI